MKHLLINSKKCYLITEHLQPSPLFPGVKVDSTIIFMRPRIKFHFILLLCFFCFSDILISKFALFKGVLNGLV